jgi:hypothetical protein
LKEILIQIEENRLKVFGHVKEWMGVEYKNGNWKSR